MSGELDEKGMLPCPFCGGNAEMASNGIIYHSCDPDGAAPYIEVEGADAWNRRAYLAASPSPSMEMEVVATSWVYMGKVRYAHDVAFSPSDIDRGIVSEVTPLVTLSSAQSALAAMRADRDSLQAALNGVRDNRDGLLVAAEAQVQRLTEENEALREKSDEFETGLVDFHRELSAAEARIKALEEALGNVLSHVSDTLGCGRHCVIEAEAEDEAEYTTAIQAARSTLKENAL